MTWTVDPREFGKEVRRDHRALTLSIAFDVDSRLIAATPVDTGRARSNWLPSVGNPRNGEVPIRPQTESIIEAQATFSSAPVFPVCWISNNLPYIHRIIEEGHSAQAPPGTLTSILDSVSASAKRAGYGIGLSYRWTYKGR